jgi:hypothetical protein
MSQNKYPKIPSGPGQMLATTLLVIGLIVYMYFANVDARLGEDMKRFLNRTGGTLILYATVLGAWGILYSKKNKKKGAMAVQKIAEYTEGIRRMTEGKQDVIDIKNVVEELEEKKKAAERAKQEASHFDDDVVYVTVGALVFVALGTICQMLAA